MSQAIVITGMHRSGTSLVSNLLQVAGANIGDQLLAANSANPRGYFEDVDFYEFHEHLLHGQKQTYLFLDQELSIEPTADERAIAERLIATRSDRCLWGWKDPRTSLFLDFWHDLLPDARFVFVFRHPVDVLLSLVRRGEFNNHPTVIAGLHAWNLYNTRIQDFYDQHSGQCVLVHIDGVTSHVCQFVELLKQKLHLDISLDPAEFHAIFHSSELQQLPAQKEVRDVLAKLSPQTLELYAALNSRADLPANAGVPATDSSPHLVALANLAEALPTPLSFPIAHSLLQLLLSLLSPEHTETMLHQFYRSAGAAQRTIDQLWLYAQQLERSNAEQQETLRRQQSQMENQQAEIEQRIYQLQTHSLPLRAQSVQLQALTMQLQDQGVHIQRQHHELNQQAARIQALVGELTRVYGTRAGKFIRAYWRFQERWRKKET